MRVGLDRLAEEAPLASLVRGSRFGLLAHPASVDRSLRHVSEVLASMALTPQILFGPEHGYGGEAQDMIGVPDARDRRGVPVRSLYGAELDALSPRAGDVAGLDVMLIDLADVGSRYYTYVWTAVLVARVCARHGVRVVVLDRPNPLGAVDYEGKLQDARFRSFVGLEPLPVRHGLTLGEIVAWRAAVEGFADAVTVVAHEGIGDALHAPSWDRPFVMPSPNMPTYDVALVYPGGCLVEGTNLSEGRGTTRPFEIVGAPFVDGVALASALAETGLPGFCARPVSFLPTFHKHAGAVCGGVEVHVTDAATFRPYATYLALVCAARRLAPGDFRFRTERYEFVDDIPAFDLLTGSDEAREAIEAGAMPRDVAELRSPVSRAEADVRDAARAAFSACSRGAAAAVTRRR